MTATGTVLLSLLLFKKGEATTCRSGDCTGENQNVPNILTSYTKCVKTIQSQLLLVYNQMNKAMNQTTF